MRFLGHLTCITGLFLLSITAGLAWWRDQGPSTASFLVLSEYRNRETEWDLIQIRADGSHRQILVSSPAFETVPDWSSDGQRLVFARNVAFRSSIWGYDFATQQSYSILGEQYDVFAPNLSPDGTKIIAEARPRQISTLLLIDLQTGAVQTIAEDLTDKMRPHWTSDGRHLIFNTETSIQKLTLADNTIETILPMTTIHGVDVSPDGTWLAFLGLQETQYALMRVNIDGSELQVLTTPNVATSRPAISTDGRWIAYGDQGALYKIASDGGTPQLILNEQGVRFSDPTWSPIYDLPFQVLPTLGLGGFEVFIGLCFIILWKGK